jgi:bifunctional N-acetylglucosamine-1-phosphate-uridyltransferase/glucosamine-1-phosphate-acetyltransferase GlmU-like protein
MTERACIILAAGMGTRLGLKDVPKVMVGLHDKPLLHHTVETVLKTNPDNFIVVTGHKGEVIKRYFGNDLIYQRQEVLNGNAGALREGLKGLNNRNKNVLVLQGDDSAFYKTESLLNLISLHERSGADLTMIFTNEYDKILIV